MKDVLIDTNYLIDYLRGKSYTRKIINKVRKKEIKAYISVITTFELEAGVGLLSSSSSGKAEVKTLFEWFDIIDIDKVVAGIAAKIYTPLRKAGALVDMRDILMASCALSRNIPILTNNKKRYKGIAGLDFVKINP